MFRISLLTLTNFINIILIKNNLVNNLALKIIMKFHINLFVILIFNANKKLLSC